MPLDAEGNEPSGGGAKAFLTKKAGPLPVWGWVAVGGVLLGLLMLMHKKRAGATSQPVAQAVGTPVGSGATGFTQDQLGQLSSLVNGEVASAMANSAGGTAANPAPAAPGPGSTAPATNPIAAYVNSEFHNLLGREADASGGAYWTNQLAGGQTNSQQFLQIAGSGEARQYAAANPSAFVTGEYETLLNRQPDAGGLAYWTSVLQQSHGDTAMQSQQFLQAAQPELRH